jgi:hypothetical protein
MVRTYQGEMFSLLGIVLTAFLMRAIPAAAELETKEKHLVRRSLTTALDPSTATAANKVVTLGDSFTSGTGIHLFNFQYDDRYGGNPTYDGVTYKLTHLSTNECFREVDTTPGAKHAKATGAQSVLLACAAAEINEISNQFDYLNAIYPEDTLSNWTGSTIIMTGGGHNMHGVDGTRWGDIIVECFAKLDPFLDCYEEASNQLGNLDEIQTNMTTLLTKVAAVAGGATIRIFGYPKIFSSVSWWG